MATDMQPSDYVLLTHPPIARSSKTTCMITTFIVSLLVIASGIAGYFVFRRYTKESAPSSISSTQEDTLLPTLLPTLNPSALPVTGPINVASDYDLYFANRLVKFCLISYCISDKGTGKVDTWDCSHCNKYYPKLVNVTVVETNWNHDDVDSYVVYDDQYYQYNGQKQPSIVIAFEGTNPLSITDWIDDLDVFEKPFDACPDCFVHRGISDAYSIVSKELWEAVKQYRNVFGSEIPVQVTGHSLGAGLAVFCALDGVDTYGIVPQVVYTYGQPRVGNHEFARYYNSRIPIHYRVTHSHDPIPHLPSGWMGTHSRYWHVAAEVFYQTDSNGSYVVCDGSGEDKQCSAMFWMDVNVLNHLEYMGYDFTKNYLAC
eukprot:609506_1